MYRSIVFLQGDDFPEFEKVWEEHGFHRAAEYLMQWESGETTDVDTVEEPWGAWDSVYRLEDGYIMTVNWRLGYAGLCQRENKDE